MADPIPAVATQITHHTLWQALTGSAPPRHLPPFPIGRAVADSRLATPGDLFAALPGDQADGNDFVGDALERQARAVICEPRALQGLDAASHPVVIANCRTRSLEAPNPNEPAYPTSEHCVLYVVPDSMQAIRDVGLFQRLHRTRRSLRVVGITGSVGKSSTKELVRSVFSQHFETYCNPGNLNGEHALPLVLMGLSHIHERFVTELGMYRLGEIDEMCGLTLPHMGIVTNVGPSHLERLGTIENIFRAKSELVRALPPAESGGVAILNWDDPMVRRMEALTEAQVVKVGLTPDCDVWADQIQSIGFKGCRFRLHLPQFLYPSGRTIHVKSPLLGRHSVHNTLLATAAGLIEGIPLQKILAGLRDPNNQIRLMLVDGVNNSTLIDDTYNASEASALAALNLLADLKPERHGRRIAVLGDMRELGSSTETSHLIVGSHAADVSDLLVTVGQLGRLISEAARASRMASETVYQTAHAEEALSLLSDLVRPDDLILIKGSRAVGMEEIVSGLSARRF